MKARTQIYSIDSFVSMYYIICIYFFSLYFICTYSFLLCSVKSNTKPPFLFFNWEEKVRSTTLPSLTDDTFGSLENRRISWRRTRGIEREKKERRKKEIERAIERILLEECRNRKSFENERKEKKKREHRIQFRIHIIVIISLKE